jgi:hypothetical protein
VLGKKGETKEKEVDGGDVRISIDEVQQSEGTLGMRVRGRNRRKIGWTEGMSWIPPGDADVTNALLALLAIYSVAEHKLTGTTTSNCSTDILER